MRVFDRMACDAFNIVTIHINRHVFLLSSDKPINNSTRRVCEACIPAQRWFIFRPNDAMSLDVVYPMITTVVANIIDKIYLNSRGKIQSITNI